MPVQTVQDVQSLPNINVPIPAIMPVNFQPQPQQINNSPMMITV
jgi:hypothetical protein